MTFHESHGDRFLVTGALGCIGSWVVRRLLDEGAGVVAVDAGGSDHRVRALLAPGELERVTWAEADISNGDAVAALFAAHDPTHVIHLAALQVPACAADPIRGAAVNVVGTVALLHAATSAQLASTFVYASSVASSGRTDDEPEPSTHYGVFKRANEGNARVFWESHALPSIGLRPYVVYGPGRDQGLTSDPTKAMRAAALGEPFTIGYRGRAQLQYAPDVAAYFVAAARATVDGAHVLNTPGVHATVDEIVAAIERAAPGSTARITVDGGVLPFPEEVAAAPFDALLGVQAVTPLDMGVADTVAFFAR
ncbi:MAG TPA: NAD-dependent epimerase/dehydratase family protein [Gaiellaceae bacterium]|nr:NAD-dependent epimerase/dehydratase family protein [Gaiellaceae bacterium]